MIVYAPLTDNRGAPYDVAFLNYPSGIGIGLHINNAGTIVGCSTNQPNGLGAPGMLFTPGQASNSMTIFPEFSFFGVSNGIGGITPKISGHFSGSRRLKSGPMRMEASGASYQVLEGSGRRGFGINDQGDVCLGYGRGAIYTDYNNLGLLDLDKNNLVVNRDAEWDQAILHLKAISNRNATNFGVIAGNTYVPLAPLGEGEVFLLTPQMP